MKSDDVLFIALITTILLVAFCTGGYRLENRLKINHKELLTAIETSTQIEDELIEAVNSAIEHIESQPLDFDCSAMVEFLEGVKRARINRTKRNVTGE